MNERSDNQEDQKMGTQKATHKMTQAAFRRGFVRGMRLSREDQELLRQRMRMYATYMPPAWERPAPKGEEPQASRHSRGSTATA